MQGFLFRATGLYARTSFAGLAPLRRHIFAALVAFIRKRCYTKPLLGLQKRCKQTGRYAKLFWKIFLKSKSKKT
jgi:hypothetical protein